MAKNRSHYDVIVFGSNLTGVALSYALSRQGKKVLLLEESDDLGKNHHTSAKDSELFRSSLELISDTDTVTKAMNWFSELILEKIVSNSFEQSSKTYSDAKFKSFVGFKDLKFESGDEVHWFTQGKVRHLTSSPQFWIATMLETKAFQVAPLTKITEYIVEDGLVKGVKVNSTKTLTADHYVHCETPWWLDKLVSDKKSITAKEKTAFSKMEGWTLISLQLLHKKQITEDLSSFVLHGSKTDFEPTIGRFFRPDLSELKDEPTLQNSTWNCLMSADAAEDMEHVGATLRNMKKQIKRAFPEALSEGTQERIQVIPNAIGSAKSEGYEQTRLSKIDNLYLASPLNTLEKDIGAFLVAAHRCLENFAVDETAIEAEA